MPHRSETIRHSRRLTAVALLALAAALCAGVWARDHTAAVSPPIPLAADQARAVGFLLDGRPQAPAPLFLFTDPNKDPDDLSVLVLAGDLQERGFIDLRCVVTTLGDRETRLRRARFAKDVLEDLGMSRVKVGVGGDYGFEVKDAEGKPDREATDGRRKDHGKFIDTRFEHPRGAVAADGLALLESELAGVPDGSAVLLVNAGMADVAALLRDAPELVKRKTARVVIMGGVEPKANESGLVVADRRAYNNTTHQPSADFVYQRVQELGIPLLVVTKEAAYAASAPRGFYEGMAATGHPVGAYLRDQQKQSLHNLWSGIQQGHMPPALTSEWFFETFTDVDIETPAGQAALSRAEENAGDFEALWQQVTKFNLYDPLALLAATPGAGERLFRADSVPGAREDVKVVGEASVKDPELVKDLMSGLAVRALSR